MTLVGPDLQPRSIHLTSVRDGQLGFFDETRELRHAPLADFVQLRGFPVQAATDPGDDEPDPAAGMIDLVDGTRLSGRMNGWDEDGTKLQWQHPVLGEVVASLDDLAAVSRGRPLNQINRPVTDRITMTNGDVIEGFLERMVAVRVAGGQDLVELPLERIAMIVTSNPLQTVVSDCVHLADDSRILVDGLTIENDTLRAKVKLPRGAKEAAWPLHAVRRIDLAQSGLALVALAELPMRLMAGGQVFGVIWKPRTSADHVLLHAPMTVEYELPVGAARLAATVELALDNVPALARLWADCDITVTAGSAPPQRIHLYADQPRAAINLPIQAHRLIIQLDAGVNGPMLDRVRLVDAMVLVRTAGQWRIPLKRGDDADSAD